MYVYSFVLVMAQNNNTMKRKNVPITTASSRGDSSQTALNEHIHISNSAIHGSLYHLHIAAVILLRAYDTQQKNKDFNFNITVEDPHAGKFDDVVLRYSSQQVKYGAVYLQIKHKDLSNSKHPLPNKKSKTTPTITKAALLDKGKTSNPPYSIPVYFLSFVESNHKMGQQNYYFLCTNAQIDDDIIQYFSQVIPSKHYILQCYQDLDATFYQFNPDNIFGQLELTIKTVSLDKLGKLLAKSIYNKQKITLDNPLYNMYAVLISKIVEQSNTDLASPQHSIYKFKKEFLEAPEQSTFATLRTALVTEYKKNLKVGKEVWSDVDEKKIWLDPNFSITAVNDMFDMINKDESEYAKIDAKIKEFYGKFMLVCKATNELTLESNAKKILATLTDTELNATFNNMHLSILDAMKKANGLQLDSIYLSNIFKNIKCNTCYIEWADSTKQYIECLNIIYSFVQINPTWLQKSCFYSYIDKKSTDKNYYYFSSKNVHLSSIIIIQTLQLLQIDYLFIDTSKFHNTDTLEQHLQYILRYINEVNYASHSIIIILEQHNSSISEMLNKYQHRLILLANTTEDKQTPEECLLVQDLTQESLKMLFMHNDKLNLFGTSTSLTSIVRMTDDLSVLLDVLNFATSTGREESNNINNRSYNKIKNNYIHRHLQHYPASIIQETQVKHDFNKSFNALKSWFAHKTLSFHDILHKYQNEPIFHDIAASITNKTHCLENAPDMEHKCKLSVVLDEAGSGKSTYFTWLAWYLSKEYPSMFVVKLNAIEYSSEFDRLSKGNVNDLNDTEVIRILYQFIFPAVTDSSQYKQSEGGIYNDCESSAFCFNLLQFSNGQINLGESNTKKLNLEQLIQLRLFCNKFNTKKIVLLLDGYDEIVPNYSAIVIKCLKSFASYDGIKKMFLSSRPHEFQDYHKTSFEDFKMFQLKPFSRNDQILSLHKFLLDQMTEYYQCDEDHRIVLLGIAYLILDNCLKDLVIAPLLLQMSIEKFLPVIRQHVNFHSKTISGKLFSSEKFDTLQLVKSFVSRKLDILTNEKSGLSEISSKTVVARCNRDIIIQLILRQHSTLAAYVIFDNSFTNDSLRKQEIKEIIAQNVEKSGIINGVIYGMPMFVHRIFAEYFAATWLYENKDKLHKEIYFRSQTFWMRHLNQTRNFFDRMIVAQFQESEHQHERIAHKFHLAVLNKSKVQVETLLSMEPTLIKAKDAAGRIPLHLALQYDNDKILQLLLNKMDTHLVNVKDNLFRWSALDYAFVTTNKNAIKSLLRHGATVNIDNLFQQLFSNDVENLIINTCCYINHIPSADDARQLAINVVQYLYHNKNVDIRVKRANLKGLSILEYCITKKMFELFKQFILHHVDAQNYLCSISNQLMITAINHKAYDIVCFVIDSLDYYPPEIKNTSYIFTAVITAIKLGLMKSFKIFLEQLCFRLNISYADDNIDDTFTANSTVSFHVDTASFPKGCCVRTSKKVLLPLPEYDEQNTLNKNYLFETLLARAVQEGNVQMIRHIIAKHEMIVTNRTIVMVMRLLPKGKRVVHDKSYVAFKYLLDRTADLYTIDNEGRNLLHMTIQNGCFFMVLCLIDAKFDRTLINTSNQWNVFHYIASSESSYNNRALQLFKYFMLLGDTERYDTQDVFGNSVYETAIINDNFDIAREMVETKLTNSSTPERIVFLLDTVERLVELDKLGSVTEYFKYLFEYGDNVWKEVYDTIYNRIPIV